MMWGGIFHCFASNLAIIAAPVFFLELSKETVSACCSLVNLDFLPPSYFFLVDSWSAQIQQVIQPFGLLFVKLKS